MDELSNLVYSRNFINKVICRVDFIRPLTNAQITSSKLQRIALTHFPVQRMDEILQYNQVKVNLQNEKPRITDERSDVLQRSFSSSTERNSLKYSNNFVLIEIQDYSTFSHLSMIYQDILTELFSTASIEIKRIGLRYINQFDSSQMRVQKNFFSPNIAFALDRKLTEHDEAFSLTKSVHRAEYIVDDMKLNFVYGLNNRNYPAMLTDDLCFMLDYDCYKEEVVDRLEEALRTIRVAHTNIQKMFESSITNNLRKVLDSKYE